MHSLTMMMLVIECRVDKDADGRITEEEVKEVSEYYIQ